MDRQSEKASAPTSASIHRSHLTFVFKDLSSADFIMTNISNRISNEKVFPTKRDSAFPSNFHQTVIKSLHKQMFRVFAHVYWAHFEVWMSINSLLRIVDYCTFTVGSTLEFFLRSFHFLRKSLSSYTSPLILRNLIYLILPT